MAAITTAIPARSGSATRAPSDPRRRGVAAVGLVVVVMVTATALVVGADRRKARIHDELESVFATVTYDEISAVVRADPEVFDDSARFVDSEQIFGAISVRADGVRYTDNQIELRWPALFFGFRRCVYVAWTPSGVDVSDASGRRCTEFIG